MNIQPESPDITKQFTIPTTTSIVMNTIITIYTTITITTALSLITKITTIMTSLEAEKVH